MDAAGPPEPGPAPTSAEQHEAQSAVVQDKQPATVAQEVLETEPEQELCPEPQPESAEEGVPPSQLTVASLITGEETEEPITDEMFDLMSTLVDSPDDSWLPCKENKQMTILKNKDGGTKKWMMINTPEYGTGIPAKYPMMNFKDHDFMKQATDEINDIVVLGQNSAGNDIIHVTLKLPGIKNRETLTSEFINADHRSEFSHSGNRHPLANTALTAATVVRAYREGAVPGRYEVLERSTTHPAVPIMGSSKDTGVKRKYIRAYQFAYSRIDEGDNDPNSHTSRGIVAMNMRGEVPENLVVRTATLRVLESRDDFRVAHVLEPLCLRYTGSICSIHPTLFHIANVANLACKLGAQNKLFGTTTLSVAGKMRKQMVKQVVADGLPKPVRRTFLCPTIVVDYSWLCNLKLKFAHLVSSFSRSVGKEKSALEHGAVLASMVKQFDAIDRNTFAIRDRCKHEPTICQPVAQLATQHHL